MKVFVKRLRWILVGMLLPVASAVAEEAAAAATHTASAGLEWIPLGAAFGIAIAAFGGATAQGRIAASFMEGASRNPGAANVLRTPLILSLVFVETLVLFTLLIAIILVFK